MCTPASTGLFACPGRTDCVQVRYRHIRQAAIPARVVLGTAVFCHQSNQYLVYEFPFCAMHMRVSSVSLLYLQNRLPSLIISVCTPASNSLIACPGLCPSQVERNNDVPLFAVDARNT